MNHLLSIEDLDRADIERIVTQAERFSEVSGTAFSFVFVVALIGNMLVNFLMGLIVHNYGVAQLTTVAYIGAALMVLLFIFIVRRLDANAT